MGKLGIMKTKRANPCSPLEEIDGNNTKRRATDGIASVESSHAIKKSLTTNDVVMINDPTKTSLDPNETSIQVFLYNYAFIIYIFRSDFFVN